jgi:hypothetical protein
MTLAYKPMYQGDYPDKPFPYPPVDKMPGQN